MMKSARFAFAAIAALALAACGGSSSGSLDSGGVGTLTVSPSASSIEAASLQCSPNMQVNVRVSQATGSPVADGTSVSLSSSSSARGRVAALSTPEALGGSATATTAGGVAQFLFVSGESTGVVTLTGSTQNPSGAGTLTGSATIQVAESTCEEPEQPVRLLISGDTTMPTNTQDVPPFLGSPYVNELTIRFRNAQGNAGSVVDGQISVAVSPVTRGAFSTLDDPETEENEFFILVGSGPVNMTAGVATIFVHSFNQPGPLTVSVSAVEAESGEAFSQDFVIQIEDGAADFLPAEVSFGVPADPVYIQGSGGPTNKPLTLTVRDSGGNAVPNPDGDGVPFNNVRLQLEAPSGSGARLTGTSAAGPVSGTDISVRTVNGVANFALNAGSLTGSHRIIATVDRADNNVDNDIQDGLTAQTTINVGDGRLFALRLISPVSNAILINPIAADFETDAEPQIDPDTGIAIPPNPDGTYSYTVSVIATDQQGNPPLPGQPLAFGKVDTPLTPSNPAFFVFSGMDGDPEEGGLLFTVLDPAEGFLDDPIRPDEAVEPGDTLILFGKSVPGNREHEAVRTVASVVDDRALTVIEPFNPNNQTGQIVDDGPVIPWVVGRSQIGFVDSSLTLDERGRGSVRLTYPISAVGQPLVLWTQGSRLESSGTKTVADAEPLVFPGVAPLILTASPASVPGNTSVTIRLCVSDGLGTPINGLFPRATSGGFSASVDGASVPASTGQATGTAGPGCVDTALSTSGLVPSGEPSTMVFAVGSAVAEVEVVPPGTARLVVEPSQVVDNVAGSFTRQLTLRLLNGDNQPISGVALTGICERASDPVEGSPLLDLIVPPGVTDADGRTTATVLISMAGCGDSEVFDESFPRTSQCLFSTESGTPEGLFTAVGLDLRVLQSFLSPPPPRPFCPPLLQPSLPTQLAVDVVDQRSDPTPAAVVTSNPSGISCDVAGSGGCVATFTVGSVTLSAPAGTTPTWSGDCTVSASSARFANVDLNEAGNSAICVVTFSD